MREDRYAFWASAGLLGKSAGSAHDDNGQTDSQQSAQAFEIDNGGSSSRTDELEGFAFDETSGLFYNSSLGYYFDPSSQLYGDAGSGHWWKYHNGQYQLVS